MAPSPQLISRDTTGDNSSASPVPPLIIAGIAFAGCILLGLGLWLGIYTYKKRNRARMLAAEGAISESDEKGFARPRPPRHVSPSFKTRLVAIENDRPYFLVLLQSHRQGCTSLFPGPADKLHRPATAEHHATRCDQRRNLATLHRERNHHSPLLLCHRQPRWQHLGVTNFAQQPNDAACLDRLVPEYRGAYPQPAENLIFRLWREPPRVGGVVHAQHRVNRARRRRVPQGPPVVLPRAARRARPLARREAHGCQVVRRRLVHCRP
jgi:hypothetical protein